MSKQVSNVDFDQIAKIINSKYENHKNKLRECCVKSSVIPLSDFYEALQTEYKNIESNITPPRVKPDALEYIDLFQAFDEYPSNLQKPKKHLLKDHNRINTTIKGAKVNSSATSINSSKLYEEHTSSASIFNDFCKFTEKLSAFKEELRKQTASKKYTEQLEIINTFARELDKLLMSEESDIEAFTQEENNKIKKISECMDHFVYIQENQDLYNVPDESRTNLERLHDLVEIITDALVAVNGFKQI